MATLRCVFMGTPEFALGPLEALAACPDAEIALVVTRPDAASGRGGALLPSPVKARALELGLPVMEARSLRSEEAAAALREAGADLFCVAAYGAILPPAVLQIPRLGCLNVHASLLPRWRGAAPMQRALLAGDERLGYSIMRMEEGLDTGPYCAQGSVEAAGRPYPEISEELSRMGGEALAEVAGMLARGQEPSWTAQDESQATYAEKVGKAEVLLDPALPAVQNMRRSQASSDAAPARCKVGGRGVRVLRARLAQGGPGQGAASSQGGRLLLGCSDGALEAIELRPDGKRAMSGKEFAAGLRGQDAAWGRV